MKIGCLSLGCPKNLVDSEVMLGLARDAGHELTSAVDDAEVLVVNTCAFIDGAKRESVDTILEMAERKKEGACRHLIVTGCLAERYRDQLLAEIPEIDAVLGTGEVPAITEAIARLQGRDARTPAAPSRPAASLPLHVLAPPDPTRPLPTYLYDADTPRVRTTPRHYAYVKVAEGCDYACAFCIIPTLRGGYRSRSPESVVTEARRLVGQGVRELILISQDTTFYGLDRGDRGALARLLRELDGLHGLEWVRLLYLYPTTITDETLAAMADCRTVCPYIDLPLQHASDRMLRAMRRPGTRHSYDRLLARIRSRLPDASLRTTFIVGFPGEQEDDVDALCDFVRHSAFDHVGVFTYSHEEGTVAHALDDDVPPAEKAARRDRVMTLQREIVRQRQADRVGQRVRLMVDGPAPEHELVLRGRLASQAPDIDPLVYLTECDPSAFPAGSLIDAEIVGARDYDLIARPL